MTKLVITKKLDNEKEMYALAVQMSKAVEKEAVIFLYGPLGAGKTTFTRGFLSGLGYEGKVKSPTYSLVEPYEVNGKIIFHFDFYRVDNPNELDDIGIQEYFFPTAICLIEWPENGLPALPDPDLACYIDFTMQDLNIEGRQVRLEALSECGEKILQKL